MILAEECYMLEEREEGEEGGVPQAPEVAWTGLSVFFCRPHHAVSSAASLPGSRLSCGPRPALRSPTWPALSQAANESAGKRGSSRLMIYWSEEPPRRDMSSEWKASEDT